MTQPQRGSGRSEVDDLRHIVDRLDLLMGGGSPGADHAGGRAVADRAVSELVERIGALEEQVDELRTLVNHLMTIATWQAKVTAQLVDDEVGDAADDELADDDAQDDGRPTGSASYDDRPGGHATAEDARRRATPVPANDRPPPRFEHRREEPGRGSHIPRARRTTTLDDDIDDILGVDRGHTSDRDTGPPDFGI